MIPHSKQVIIDLSFLEIGTALLPVLGAVLLLLFLLDFGGAWLKLLELPGLLLWFPPGLVFPPPWLE